MTIGFIGLGHMGSPMAERLIDAGHDVIVCDTQPEATRRAVARGACAADTPRDVAERAETVLASLPSLQASLQVVGGPDGIIHGSQIRRFIDMSTVGQRVAEHNHATLRTRGIEALDCPVSGGVRGAQTGALALMISGAHAEFATVRPILETLGNPFYIGEKPGAAQTMKLVNNLMAAATLAATAEVVVMGVKAGLDPTIMIDVLNAGSGSTHASRDKFPRSVLPRTFDFGFATGLMVKDVRLYMEEAAAIGVGHEVAAAVCTLWETVLDTEGPDADFTAVVKPLEAAAGVIIDGRTTPPTR